MTRLFLMMIAVFLLQGCTSPNQALLMTDEDVAQTVALRESRDAKICLKLDGMIDLSTLVTGSHGSAAVDGLIVTGKKMTFRDCHDYFKGRSIPVGDSTLTVDPDGVVSVEVPE